MANSDNGGAYYIRVRGRVRGPYSIDQLTALRERREFSRANEVSSDGKTWQPATVIDDLLGSPKPASAARPVSLEANSVVRPAVSGPPARPVLRVWHYYQGAEKYGPATVGELQRLITEGTLTPADVVWKEGMADWLAIRDVPELHAENTGAKSPTSTGTARRSSAREIRIGRDVINDCVLDFPMISPFHARLSVRTGGKLELEDLGSVNGTAVGSPERKIVRSPVTVSDTVYFGSLRVPVSRLLASVASDKRASAQLVSVRNDITTFGRDSACDQVLDDPMISARHARVVRKPGRVIVEDLGSANGTFLNGQRIKTAVSIQPGDELTLGSYSFRITASGDLEQRDYRGNITIEARGLTVQFSGKKLLENISLTIYPTEFVGLMGPSGAGKTTLMTAMNGYTRPAAGQVLVNGQDLYSHYQQFAGQFGYVPQDDIIHRELTVREALYYTARLRLPPDFSEPAIRERVQRVLAQLGLEGIENILIGSPEKKGISGGQRKRVNLAQELLTDPSVLFLDEPTSGLSSQDALMVMQVLRGLADTGKAILLTIHQPSSEAFRLMDNLVVVAKDYKSPHPAQLIYYGPTYPHSVKFFNPDNLPAETSGGELSPDLVLAGFGRRPTAEWFDRYSQSTYWREYIEQRTGRQAPLPAEGSASRKVRTSGWLQFQTLFKRCLSIRIKDVWNTAILLAQAPIVGLLVVLVFGSDVRAPMTDENWPISAQATATTTFLLCLAALWFGCSNAVREIVAERAIYQRERMVNLKLAAYVASKLAVLGLLCLVQCGVLAGIAVWGCELRADGLGVMGVLLVVSAVGLGIGLVISAAANTSEVAIAVLPIVLLPMVILGGVLQPVHKMNDVVAQFSHTIPSRWAFEAMLTLESHQRRKGPAMPVIPKVDEHSTEDSTDEDDRTPDVAQRFFPSNDRHGYERCLIVLGIMFAGLIIATMTILRMRDIH